MSWYLGILTFWVDITYVKRQLTMNWSLIRTLVYWCWLCQQGHEAHIAAVTSAGCVSKALRPTSPLSPLLAVAFDSFALSRSGGGGVAFITRTDLPVSCVLHLEPSISRRWSVLKCMSGRIVLLSPGCDGPIFVVLSQDPNTRKVKKAKTAIY